MGLKRIVARVELTYPADDPRTLEELRNQAPVALTEALEGADPDTWLRLAYYAHLNASVDPDPEPTLPPADPGDQTGFAP